MGKDHHIKPRQYFRKSFTGITKTNNPHSFTPQLGSPVCSPDPFPFPDFLHATADMIQEVKHHSQHMFGNRIPVTFRAAHTLDSFFFSEFGVNQLHSASQPSNPFKRRGSLQHGTVNFQPGGHYQPFYIRDDRL